MLPKKNNPKYLKYFHFIHKKTFVQIVHWSFYFNGHFLHNRLLNFTFIIKNAILHCGCSTLCLRVLLFHLFKVERTARNSLLATKIITAKQYIHASHLAVLGCVYSPIHCPVYCTPPLSFHGS